MESKMNKARVCSHQSWIQGAITSKQTCLQMFCRVRRVYLQDNLRTLQTKYHLNKYMELRPTEPGLALS